MSEIRKIPIDWTAPVDGDFLFILRRCIGHLFSEDSSILFTLEKRITSSSAIYGWLSVGDTLPSDGQSRFREHP